MEALFHWAPSERRLAIIANGLAPYAHPVCHTGSSDDDERLSFPYICFGPTPQLAWSYSGGSRDSLVDEFDGWDLWQVKMPDGADVHVLPFWGSLVQEVRLRTAVPASHVWYVATRTSLAAEATA